MCVFCKQYVDAKDGLRGAIFLHKFQSPRCVIEEVTEELSCALTEKYNWLPYTNPNPNLLCAATRNKTFKDFELFKYATKTQIERLVESGYYYDSVDKVIKCFRCNDSHILHKACCAYYYEQTKEESKCKICLLESIMFSFLCGHTVCKRCFVQMLSSCPFCRTEIKGFIRLYI